MKARHRCRCTDSSEISYCY